MENYKEELKSISYNLHLIKQELEKLTKLNYNAKKE